jgi:6-phosphogluconolactonase (cycloisomerase 2 family)
MDNPIRAAALGAAAVTAVALLVSPASAVAAPLAAPAVFVQTDDPAGNSVLAYSRDHSGGLQLDATYLTGGLGGVLDGSAVDHTASQGAVSYDAAHQLLYVTNAGSDTITVFRVRGTSLQRTQVITSGGTFPVSIAVHGNRVFVLDARDGGAIQGYVRAGDFLARVPQWHRTLHLDPNATPEFTHTPGQVAFTPDGSTLLVTTKANTSAVDAFALDGAGNLAAAPVVTSLPGAVPFAMAFDRVGHVLVAEAGTNSLETFTVEPNGSLQSLSTTATGQAATCWVTRVGRYAYLSNAGSANLSGYRLAPNGTTVTPLGETATDAGTVDAAATSNGHYLYVETGGAGIVDEFLIGADGALTSIGSVTVPDAVGAEGIAAT